MREGRFEDVVERMTKKGKMRPGETGEIKGAETDSERGGFLVSEQQQAREREGKERGEPWTSWQITFPRTESGALR